jgi:hypothetical protein
LHLYGVFGLFGEHLYGVRVGLCEEGLVCEEVLWINPEFDVGGELAVVVDEGLLGFLVNVEV